MFERNAALNETEKDIRLHLVKFENAIVFLKRCKIKANWDTRYGDNKS